MLTPEKLQQVQETLNVLALLSEELLREGRLRQSVYAQAGVQAVRFLFDELEAASKVRLQVEAAAGGANGPRGT